jgi:hypothetical protein
MKPTLLYALVFYCFLFGILGREVGGFSYGLLIEGILLISWIAAFVKTPREDWASLKSELFFLFIIWFFISVAEVMNPGASVMGWLMEIRSVALYPVLVIPLGLLVFKENRHLDVFLLIVIACSTLAALNGIKQLHYRPWPGEQRFLDQGGYITHILWGRLRVFSFYGDAGQFGASQAHVGLMALILALGPFRKSVKIGFLVCASLMLYGMLISGTRGALFALVVGAFVAIFLSKKFKVLLLGGMVTLSFLFFLKYTHIANGNYQIYRLRSALNPEDPSLNVRFNTQRNLREYMSTRPFGGGLGVIGANGTAYNDGTYLASVQPDSYFVKVWAMYGIVGLTIWLCIMLYILGKCCGLVWKIEDPALKIKMIALTSGAAGILFCSYGNEVINNMPSSLAVCLSWVFVFLSPKLEKAEKSNLLT